MNIESQEQWLQDISTDDIDVMAACGISLARLEQKDEIIQAMMKHSCIFSVKAELDQVKEGLDELNLPSIIGQCPKGFLSLFLKSDKCLTAASLQDLYRVTFSPEGSNNREKEMETILFWVRLLNDSEQGCLFSNQHQVQLGDILAFCTGVSQVPPVGFEVRPSIEFNFCTQSGSLPTASTCSNVLELPLINSSYEDFRDKMAFALANTIGFGCI